MDVALITKTKNLLLEKLKVPPYIAIITGSGIKILNKYKPVFAIKYNKLPVWSNYKKTSVVKGHEGVLKLYRIKRKNVLVFSGRQHLYEGFSIDEVITNVRLTHELGIKKLIITNASGGISKKIREGDLLLITGFINLLQGTERGTLSAITQPPVKVKSKFSSQVSGLRSQVSLKEGIYAANLGPSYETFSEIKLLSSLGASAVGMSTVPEIIAAKSLGFDYAAISIITNVWNKKHSPTHSEVLRNAMKANSKLEHLILRLLEKI